MVRSAVGCAGVVLALGVSTGAVTASAGADGAPAGGLPYLEGELVVGHARGGAEVVELPSGASVPEAVEELEDEDGVTFARPNWIATTAFPAVDTGTAGTPGGWRLEQWNFLGKPGGVRAEGAWKRLSRAGRPGGAGITVAVVDTGLAYATTLTGFAASPDFAPEQFVPGIDLVDDDTEPLDENGHGTHVAGTIAEQITLRQSAPTPDYLTGLAYGARLMPIRVLDSLGEGSSTDVAEGILWAAKNGADVINLSLQFAAEVESCADIPDLCHATRKATKQGALIVGAAGNTDGGGEPRALYPGAAPGVLAVGATTEHGCLSAYSHYGKRTDLLGPGGGQPSAEAIKARCESDSVRVNQLSFDCFPAGYCQGYDRFAIRADLGTSMSAAHASGAAALVAASGVAGPDPTPAQIGERLRCTARPAKPQRFYGEGLLDAARAVDRRLDCG